MRNTLCNPSLSINPWRELDRLFAAATHSPLLSSVNSSQQSLPVSDLFELEDSYELRVELPGVKREQLRVELKNRALELQIKPAQSEQNNQAEQDASTERKFELPVPRFVDAEQVEAKLENGILSLKLPKSAQAKAREIEIN